MILIIINSNFTQYLCLDFWIHLIKKLSNDKCFLWDSVFRNHFLLIALRVSDSYKTAFLQMKFYTELNFC
jgi:hypothetical protein